MFVIVEKFVYKSGKVSLVSVLPSDMRRTFFYRIKSAALSKFNENCLNSMKICMQNI